MAKTLLTSEITPIVLFSRSGGCCHARPPSEVRCTKRWWLVFTHTNTEHINQTTLRYQNSFLAQQVFRQGWCSVAIKMQMYYCWRYWKQQCRWPATHLSNFSWSLSLGGITESWCILPCVGIKDKYNYSSIWFKTGPPAEKRLPTNPISDTQTPSRFPSEIQQALLSFFSPPFIVFEVFFKSSSHVLHYRL